jgi:hypothetical protein
MTEPCNPAEPVRRWKVTMGVADSMEEAIAQALELRERLREHGLCEHGLCEHSPAEECRIPSSGPGDDAERPTPRDETRRGQSTGIGDLEHDDVPQFPPCPLNSASPEDLVAHMWAMKQWARDPGFRTLERRAGGCGRLPHTSLHRAMTKVRMPRLEHLEAFVQACGAADRWDEWKRAWHAAARNTGPEEK